MSRQGRSARELHPFRGRCRRAAGVRCVPRSLLVLRQCPQDLAAYSDWQAYLPRARSNRGNGRFEVVGSRWRALRRSPQAPVHGKVVSRESAKRFERGEHAFELEPQGESQTRFHHWERFDGVLVRLLGSVLEQTKRAFEQMNVALDRRVVGD